MADVALKAGIAWKKAVVQERFGRALRQLFADMSNPAAMGQIPADQSLVGRYADELKTLDGADKGKAWDLVKRNLELGIRMAKDDLVSLEKYFAGKDHIWPEGGEMAELRRKIEDLKRKLKALEDEGRP